MRVVGVLLGCLLSTLALAKTAHPKTKAAAPVVDPGPAQILFTFDDGPSNELTPKVLELLEQHHIHAVFFVNGWHFSGNRPAHERAREILRDEIARGHLVGNHTVNHYFLCGHYYIKQAEKEINTNAELIAQATGKPPELFRTPYGAHCPALTKILDRLHITPIGWDIDPQDWKVRNAKKIETYVIHQLKKQRGRAIVLLHDIHFETIRALPKILDWIEAENLRRTAAKQDPIQIVDYSYLLPAKPAAPPP